MLPPLVNLAKVNIGAPTKRKLDERGEEDKKDKEDEENEEGWTDAKKLLKILNNLPDPFPPEYVDNLTGETVRPSIEEPPSFDWVWNLSDRQFDMLLSMRLYTGALYRFIAPALDLRHQVRVQNSSLLTLELLDDFAKSTDNKDALIGCAIANWVRRKEYKRLPDDSLRQRSLFNSEAVKESVLYTRNDQITSMVGSSEQEYREMFADSLTLFHSENTGVRLRSDIMGNYYDLVVDRIAGRGPAFDRWKTSDAAKTFANAGDDTWLRHQALRDFWSAMQHAAKSLRLFILESGQVVPQGPPMPVYRGQRKPADTYRLHNSFVSASLSESVSRNFTNDPDLTDDDAGKKSCCMIRASLLPGTPYLHIDNALWNSFGWGFALQEREIILPPGLTWIYNSQRWNRQPASFPGEIKKDTREWEEKQYYVEYFTVNF